MAGWHGLDKDCGPYNPDDSAMVLVDRKELAVLRRDAERLKGLREMCGYVEDGSCESVTVSQDDATRDWIVRIGGPGSRRWYHGRSFGAAIDAAVGAQSTPQPADQP